MVHGSGRQHGTRPVGWHWRRTVVVAVVALALTLGVPAPQALGGSAGLPLSWLWDWFALPAGWATPPLPSTPQQQSAGTAAGRPHTVPASATRAGHGSGRKPGAGAGQLPAYAPKEPVRKPTTTTAIAPALRTPSGALAPKTAAATANQAPQVTAQYPPQNYGVPTLTPQLIAGGTDDGQPNSSLQYDFWLFDSSGKQLTQVGPLSTGVWQVPSGTLKWGQLYEWAVEAFDGAVWSQPSPVRFFSTAVPQPPVTSKLSQNAGGRGIEPGIGNYTTSATDADVATVGPALAIQRYYNSADPRVSGAFGTGWSSVLDSRVTEQKDAGGALQSVVVTYPDGPQIGFGRNGDGSFAPPLGRFATLSAVSGGYTLVDKNSTKYTFTQAAGTGTYGLSSIADASGRSLSFGYTGGQVTTMTSNVSTSQTVPRALHLTWFTPAGATAAHIHTVVTDPAVPGDNTTAQTWTYGYAGDRLSSVCPPTSTTACTAYGYASTTQYPGTVTDLGPRSYWRLADPPGATVATSSVLANEGSDNGAYTGVTLGQPGPLPGATSSAGSFSAANKSNVLLQPGVVSNASYQSISLWFKTTTADGVLFSYQNGAITNPTAPGAYVPALYVGSDGKLLGKFWTTVYSAPVMSPSPVTDGRWHHVVLTGGGNTQSLYLDGAKLGDGSGTIQLYDANGAKNVYLGAGFIGGGWPDEPYYNPKSNAGYPEYFTGQLAEASFYDKWLSGTQVGALYAAGHAAANVLSTTTRPSGNIAATVSYDPGSGRVAQVTDANGGVWKLGAPTVSGSSQVFATAVMGGAPADYWRLGDGSGPTAVNQVHGGTATYSAVTLGAAGPFSDATASSLDGVSSYLKLPGGLLPASGPRTVGLWFNTTQTGGVLLSQQAQGLGGTACPCYPALWIGSDGTLRGSVPANTPTGPMTGMANKCLDLSAFGQTDGTKVQLYTCTGAYNQVWQPWPDGTVRNPSSGKCLDITAYGTANGSKVQLWTCTGAANQVWQPQANGAWKNPVSGRCLDLQGPSSADGTQAWIWDCYGGPGQLWKASMVSPSPVNDGKWHYAVLSTDGTAQALYVDGTLAGSSSGPALASTAQPNVYVGAGRAADGTGTAWSSLPAGTDAYFKGSVSDVAFYRSQLSATQVSTEFAASKSSAGLTPVVSTVLTDPTGKPLRYDYDATVGGRLIATTDGFGYTTRYGYDTGGFLDTVTDPNGNVSTTGHDLRGNVVSSTTCQNLASNACSTTYLTYYPDDTSSTLTPDPRNDLVLTVRDPRSSSASDNAYLTTYAYDTAGNRTGVTTPPVPGLPNGRTTTTAYTSTGPGAPNNCIVSTPENPPQWHPPVGLPALVTTPGGAVTQTCYTVNGDVMEKMDAAGLSTRYSHDGLGRVTDTTVVSDTFPSGLKTSFTYDGLDRTLTRTEPAVTDRVTGAVHTPKTTTVYDADGNVTSSTVADLTGGDASRTSTATYNSHGQQITATDAAGATTTFGYDLYGNRTSVIDAAGTETDTGYDPNGHLLTTTLKGYTGDPVNPSPAKDLVRESRAYDPAGRLASVTDAMGWVTSYAYTDNGLAATVTRSDPVHGTSFVQESDSYDAAGNLTTKVTNNGVTRMTSVVDAANRITTATLDPAGVNRGTTYGYSPDDAVVSTRVADANGSSTIEATYDPMGRMTSRTVDGVGASPPDGWWKLNETSGTTATDSGLAHLNGTLSGGVSWSAGAASFDGSGGAVATAGPALSTTQSFTVSAWVNLATTAHDQTVVSQDATHNSGFVLQYDSVSNRWLFAHLGSDAPVDWSAFVESSVVPATGTWTHLVGVYDGTAHTATLYVNGAQSGTGNDPGSTGSNGPLAIGRDRVNDNPNDYLQGSAANVQAYQRALSATDVSTLYGDGRAGGALVTGKLRTSWQLDKRGLPVSQTDPNGNTTRYAFDEAARLAVATAPAVNTETNGGTPAATHPISMVGYDTFGEPAEASDPLGNLLTTAYDAAGRPVSVTLPAYTPPGGGTPITAVASKTYNNRGQVVTDTDPLGHQATYAYDQLGRRATVTAPNGGVTHDTYDLLGDQLSSTDPTGAVGQATYDYLGRKVTTTQVVRQPAPAAYTTTYGYNTAGGWLSSATTPGGSATTFGYDNAGERTKVVDAANNATLVAYDYAGRVVKTTLPDGSAVTGTYDAAGRQIGGARLGPTGTLLAGTSFTFDNNGNALTAKDPRGHTTSYTYDALNHLSGETQPVSASASITTGFGYDAAGHRTRFTDGRGNPFITTFNPWGLPESTIEPSTPAYPNAVDRTFTTTYDAAGRIATQTSPGGVSVTDTYDTIGDLTGQTGTGADAATSARAFGYDTDGRVTSASAPGGTDTFTLDDRGLLLSATGPSGASSFAYNGDGLMTSRIDAAGTAAYTYDTTDRLKTLTDPSTGTVLTYGYNNLSQPAQITYGSGTDTRTFGYDAMHRLASDTLRTSAGATVGSITYGYDANGNETSKTTTGFAGSAANTYTYDDADRLTSWTAGSSTTSYAYDDSGNRTQAGSQTFAYNARNQITTGGGSTYTYTARGTLASVATGGTPVPASSNAFGQTVTQGGQTYAYDAIGRVVTDATSGGTSRTFSYTGVTNTVASDGTATYSRDPGGALVGIKAGGRSLLAWTDRHTDVVGDFTATGTSLAGSTTYDPLGKVLASNAPAGNLGYQSGWSEPSTGRVDMAARWYNPASGQFDNRDSVANSPAPDSVGADRYAYANDNPLTGTDPTGHMRQPIDGDPPPPGTCYSAPQPSASCPPRQSNPGPPKSDPGYCSAPQPSASCSPRKPNPGPPAKPKPHNPPGTCYSAPHPSASCPPKEPPSPNAPTPGYCSAPQHSASCPDTPRPAASPPAPGYCDATGLRSASCPEPVRPNDADAGTVNCTWASASCGERNTQPTGYAASQYVLPNGTVVTHTSDGRIFINDVDVTDALHVIGGGPTLADIASGFDRWVGDHPPGPGVNIYDPQVTQDVLFMATRDDYITYPYGSVFLAYVTYGSTGFQLAAGSPMGPAMQYPGVIVRGEEPEGAGGSVPRLPCNSFDGKTPVLLADGRRVPIDDVKLGEQVLATDPHTGTTVGRPVTVLHRDRDSELTDLVVTGADGRAAVIHTTQHHRFWDGSRHDFVDANQLAVGDSLRTPNGQPATVTGVRNFLGRQWMYNLTVDTDHTYYVIAGTTPVLVHNENCVSGSLQGQQLADRLRNESARSPFTADGGLNQGAIGDSRLIISGNDLGNARLRARLTSDGSNIADWGKYTTQTYQSPYGDFQVHYYYNRVTGAVDYGYDYKVVMNAR